MRKMTGKAAELAAILTRLPLDSDFCQQIEEDLAQHGVIGGEKLEQVYSCLRELPLRVTQDSLRERLSANRQWYIEQLMEVHKLAAVTATEKADATFDALFAGWRDPTLRRTTRAGAVVEEVGAPLRAMVGYLFGEVAKNFYLIFHTDQWIEYVSRSQGGDRCFEIDPEQLPSHEEMLTEMAWEKGITGPALMEKWLAEFAATPFNYNRGLDDESLSATPPLNLIEGTNFFRGLALIDLAEAMLKRAFGQDVVAVRVNAAGQGDFFQVHIDTSKTDVEQVKQFIGAAFYRRFDLSPAQPFVEPHPGGGAVGTRLSRFDKLPELVRELRARVDTPLVNADAR
jgi:hypothetical protein